jgi:hypothetical protein
LPEKIKDSIVNLPSNVGKAMTDAYISPKAILPSDTTRLIETKQVTQDEMFAIVEDTKKAIEWSKNKFKRFVFKEEGIGEFSSPKDMGDLKTMSKVERDKYITDLLKLASRRFGLPFHLLNAQMRQESGGKVGAVSHKGATGLMQLMPKTAAELGVTNMRDVPQNVYAGSKFLSQLLNSRKGVISESLAGYNAGLGAVKEYGGVPHFPETLEYIPKIINLAEKNYIKQRLDEINAGGDKKLFADNDSYNSDVLKKEFRQYLLDHGLLRGADSHNKALVEAKKKFSFTVEPVITDGTSADRDRRVRGLIAKNCNPIIVVGSGYAPTIQALAVEFPNTQFAILNDASIDALNVTSLIFADTQGAYLAGYSAALASKSGKVA